MTDNPAFEIWMEGHVATGQTQRATYCGTVVAATFKKACAIMFGVSQYYDPVRNTYYGARLFDNEADARKMFG